MDQELVNMINYQGVFWLDILNQQTSNCILE